MSPNTKFSLEHGDEKFPEKQGLYNPNQERDACGVGFVANIDGAESHQNVTDALVILANMYHRGACGCEEETGDGAGIMTGMPHEFFKAVLKEEHNIDLPERGLYAAGNLFFSRDEETRKNQIATFEKFAQEFGVKVLLWREIPVNGEIIGPSAKAVEPFMLQVFLTLQAAGDAKRTERQLYLLAKTATNNIPRLSGFYICSLSTRVVVYKGMLTAYQVGEYYPDLKDSRFKSHIAKVHSRFSTNTFPSWGRAQPLRYVSHNGEINTLRGNKNWTRAREGVMKSETFGEDLQKIFPIIEDLGSDSACLDNLLEFLLMDGQHELPEIAMMMVPEAWQSDKNITPEKQAFYQWASMIQEPWDGPALITFTDGRYIGGTLDRNGLRPCRFYLTTDHRIIMGSEVGVLPHLDQSLICYKGRLQPGKMLLVDTKEHKVVRDKDLKKAVTTARPYGEWLKEHLITIEQLEDSVQDKITPLKDVMSDSTVSFDNRLPAFGYTVEHINMLVKPMVENGKEALGSMGNDAPMAVLSKRPRLVYDYFQQLFAQVTNPPIDPFREYVVMSLKTAIGPEGNRLGTYAEQCARLTLENPVLSHNQLEAIKHASNVRSRYTSAVIDCTFPRVDGEAGISKALDRICKEAHDAAVDEEVQYLILSDRGVCADRVALPALIFVGAVHQYLLREKTRFRTALIVDSGEAREVHHICTLMGFGADAVCPYMVFEIMAKLRREGLLKRADMSDEEIAKNYQKSIDIGMRKVMAKMGISTLHSYKGAQIFEAVGVGAEVIDRCFTNTASRIGGVDFACIARETLARHDSAWPVERLAINERMMVENPGEYHWRDGGEKHVNSPSSIANVQDASRRNNKSAYDKYVEATKEAIEDCTLRGLIDFDVREDRAIAIDEVEPAAEIVKRFVTGAMSYGSISIEAHKTLAAAMNKLGGKSNTGEGGEDADRMKVAENADWHDNLRSAIKQIASGRFGVTSYYLSNAEELQIKMAQGAKPGEGGELPGFKVSEDIAKTRHSTPGVGLISPPPHHDIYSIEDLSQLIYDLKCSNPSARVSVKLVSEVGVGVIAAGVAKGKADHILISGHDGGTGASSWTGIKHAGLPWELGLAETHQTLVLNGLRGRVIVQTDGQIRTGRDVAIAALLGAEEFGFATVPLIIMGCTMMRKCHLNTCPVGIATQDPTLREKFAGKPEHVVNFFFMLAEHVREIMASLGFRTLNEMVGRTDCLKINSEAMSFKTRLLDYTPILKCANEPGKASYNVEQQDHGLDLRLDNKLIRKAEAALTKGDRVQIRENVVNTDRALCTTLGHEVSKAWGENGLPEDTISIYFKGSAGQSLGAFMPAGITVFLEGDANDYVGKGLSGGKIIIVPSTYAPEFKPNESIIAGNVCLYGATTGRAYLRGAVAERFCVRNSGAVAVCEGCGDHGCEYMTGGRAIVLGKTGRNFAAGMSGGVAFVFDDVGNFHTKCNTEISLLQSFEQFEEEDIATLKKDIEEHLHYTQSEIAQDILENWSESIKKFKKVYPIDYKRVVEERRAKAAAGESAKKASENTSKPYKRPEPTIFDIEESVLDKSTEDNKKRRMEKLDKMRGFQKYKRAGDLYRDPKKRLRDFDELSKRPKESQLATQGARCMDCGVPFCQSDTGCPLSNVIPQWNDLVYKGEWKEALDRLLLTNNFPEFTGRVCPAPCEGACVLGINEPAVSIKSIECAIIDKGFEMGWIVPQPPKKRTGKKIAVVGGGPAGMAAADQLNKMGHTVTVFDRNDRIGGLLMYGIPNMKLEKKIVQRRLDLMAAEGVEWRPNTDVGKDITASDLMSDYDRVLLTVGATWPRNLPIPGRDLNGIHFAMDFLQPTTKQLLDEGKGVESNFPIHVKGKHVIVIGGGDTGNDCIGTSMRMGAESVVFFEILPQPPGARKEDNPWPQWPRIFRVDYGHEEVKVMKGDDPRNYNIMSKNFIGDENGNVIGIKTVQVEWTNENGSWKMSEVEGSEREWKADYVFLAMGFLGPEKTLVDELALETDARSNFKTSGGKYATSVPGVYAAGDCRRGQSLIVWAISEGRQAARQIDIDLMGDTTLPVAGGVIPMLSEVAVKGA
eukprot:Clim_evm24s202 gene=Clim_evmTU24s202